VLAATNKDLTTIRQDGNFRETCSTGSILSDSSAPRFVIAR